MWEDAPVEFLYFPQADQVFDIGQGAEDTKVCQSAGTVAPVTWFWNSENRWRIGIHSLNSVKQS